VKALFRKGPSGRARQAGATASVRRQGGWFGKAGRAPDLPRDATHPDRGRSAALRERADRERLLRARRLVHERERERRSTRERAPNGGRIARPALFFHGLYDAICETVDSPLAGPMRESATT
jgi:hypothetical protein